METMAVMKVTEENAETKSGTAMDLLCPYEVTLVLIDIRSPNNIADSSSTHKSLGKTAFWKRTQVHHIYTHLHKCPSEMLKHVCVSRCTH